jgi:hypothetical protein
MAKELSEKSKVIREAIAANPDLGNTDLASLINAADARKKDKIAVTATDVNNQKQALKAMGGKKAAEPKAVAPAPNLTRNGAPRKKPGRKPGHKATAAPVAAPAKQASVVAVVDQVFTLANQVGGMEQLRRLVERLAQR